MVSVVSHMKSAAILIFDSLYIKDSFSLVSSNIVSLLLVLRNLIALCFSAVFIFLVLDVYGGF